MHLVVKGWLGSNTTNTTPQTEIHTVTDSRTIREAGGWKTQTQRWRLVTSKENIFHRASSLTVLNVWACLWARLRLLFGSQLHLPIVYCITGVQLLCIQRLLFLLRLKHVTKQRSITIRTAWLAGCCPVAHWVGVNRLRLRLSCDVAIRVDGRFILLLLLHISRLLILRVWAVQVSVHGAFSVLRPGFRNSVWIRHERDRVAFMLLGCYLN